MVLDAGPKELTCPVLKCADRAGRPVLILRPRCYYGMHTNFAVRVRMFLRKQYVQW